MSCVIWCNCLGLVLNPNATRQVTHVHAEIETRPVVYWGLNNTVAKETLKGFIEIEIYENICKLKFGLKHVDLFDFNIKAIVSSERTTHT